MSPDAPHPTPLKRLTDLLKPERADVWIVVVYAVIIGVLNLAAPLTAMAVVNSVALAALVQQLVVLSLALMAALGLSAVLQGMQAVVVEYMQRRLFVRVADELAYRLPRVDIQAFDRQHGPELVNRFFDVLTVQKAGATLLLDGVTIALQAGIGLVLLGVYDPMLLGFDVVLVASLLFLFFVLGRGAVGSAIDESVAKYAVAGWMEEVARHPVAFKTAGGPGFARDRTNALVQTYLRHRHSHFRRVLRQFGFALSLQAAASTALLAIGGWLVIQEKLSLGQLVAAEIVVTLVVASFSKLGKQLESCYDLLAAVDKLGHLTDLPLERGTGVPHVARAAGAAIVAHDLSFTYPDTHRPAVERLNLSVAAGERVAFVGPNGSGKTTFLDLLFGLRQPSAGRVEIDGADLRDLALESLREQVAVVKGLEIFEGTILSNVRVGRESVSLADVRDALGRVGLLDAILDLPDGLNTPIWPGSAPLSLGQATRLMLARGIVGRPRLLVLDETLDNMDDDAREQVLPAVFGPESPWTLLVITHSPDVAKLCDRSVRFDRPVP